NARVVTITETPPGAAIPSSAAYDSAEGLLDREQYESITMPGKALWLASWRDEAALAAWLASPASATSARMGRFRAVRIIRDYGMHDRREAPQYYPPVEPAAAATHGDRRERSER
ncbi:MAG TPA: hypothetical protein VIG44_12240, partial [Thermomicrobiales bacterium]